MRGRKPLLEPGDPPTTPPPEPPEFLQGEARACWTRLAADLHAVGLLHRLDLGALAAYASAFATYTEAEAKYRELGAVVQLRTGTIVTNPFLSVRNSALTLMHKLGSDLGLSPVSRQRLAVHAQPDDATDLRVFEAEAERRKRGIG